MPLAHVGHFNELACGSYLFGSGIAHGRAQLIGARLLDGMIHRVHEPMIERVAIHRPMQPDCIRLAALVHLDAVIAKGHQQNIHYGFMPVVRLVCESEVAPFDVK